jgi:hypothetical protein
MNSATTSNATAIYRTVSDPGGIIRRATVADDDLQTDIPFDFVPAFSSDWAPSYMVG